MTDPDYFVVAVTPDSWIGEHDDGSIVRGDGLTLDLVAGARTFNLIPAHVYELDLPATSESWRRVLAVMGTWCAQRGYTHSPVRPMIGTEATHQRVRITRSQR